MLTTFEHEPSSWLQASSIINNNRRHPLVPHQRTSLKQLLYHTTLVAHDKDLEDFLSTAACKKRHYVGNNYGVSLSCKGPALPWCETSRKLELLDPQATSPWRGKVTCDPALSTKKHPSRLSRAIEKPSGRAPMQPKLAFACEGFKIIGVATFCPRISARPGPMATTPPFSHVDV